MLTRRFLTVLAAFFASTAVTPCFSATDKPPIEWVTSEESLKIPDQHLPTLKNIPDHPGIVVGLRSTGEMRDRSFGIYDLADGSQSVWELPNELSKPIASGSGIYGDITIDYAPKAQQFLLARGGELDLIQKDGSYTPLHLQMPGKLKPYQGMHDYALSSSGQFIAYSLYTRDREDQTRDLSDSAKPVDPFGKLYIDLFYQSTEGSQPLSLATGVDNYIPAWSPDDSKIAYSTRDGGFEIVDLNGTKVSSVSSPVMQGPSPQPITEIRWSPDGRKIGFLLKQQLYVSDESGVKLISFRHNDIEINNFAWSPTGDQFAFHSNFEAGTKCALNFAHKFETGGFPCVQKYFLYTANVDGTNLKRITNDPEYWPREIFWLH